MAAIATSFMMIFLLLLSSVIISFTLAQPSNNATITEELIRKICSNTRNPSLCETNLRPLKRKSLLPNSISALGNGTMNRILSRAHGTKALAWAQYHAASIHRPEMRMRYFGCHSRYEDVMKQLGQAQRSMKDGSARFVKNYVSTAVDRVDSCSKELMKHPRDKSGILEAGVNLKDLCSIVSAVCDYAMRNIVSVE